MQNCATSRERPFRHNSSASSTEIGSETGLALRSECRYFLLKLPVLEAMFELRLSASWAPVLGACACARATLLRVAWLWWLECAQDSTEAHLLPDADVAAAAIARKAGGGCDMRVWHDG